jgi:uncharacterized protein
MVLGVKCYPALSAIPEKIDLVDVFRRPEHVPEVVDEAIKVGAGGLWLQLGVTNHEAAAKAAEAGLFVVQNRCLMVEEQRLKT